MNSSIPENVSLAVDDRLAREAVSHAVRTLERIYRHKHHQIVSVIATASGGYSLGVHIEAAVGRASTCAEAGALSDLILAGHFGEDSILVTLRGRSPLEEGRPWRAVPPCGICRELLLDYLGPACRVITDIDGSGKPLAAVRLGELLPWKYQPTKWNSDGA